MAPQSADAGEDASSSKPQPQARVRRRPRKRAGPPQFHFLTATDPSQFKDENAKRSVRSQAMIQYRYKADQQKRKGKDAVAPAAVAEEEEVVQGPATAAERVTPVLASEQPYQGRDIALMNQVLDEYQEQDHLYSSTSAAWLGTNPEPGQEYVAPLTYGHSSSHALTYPSRYHQAMALVPLNGAAEQVVDYEESDEYEEKQMRILVAQLARSARIGDGVDPFVVVPQFESPELSALYLVRKCNRAFVTQSTMIKWLPLMLMHPHVLLSSTILASTWLDMHAGCSGDSKRTVLVKSETIGWINERLRSPETQYEDFTLMVILHLLAGEMWSCNEKTLRIHESGVARLIVQRGGMHNLGGDGAMAEVSASISFHCDIFCEATPLPLFHNWQPTKYGPIGSATAIPESPVFCPRNEFFTLIQDPKCSQFTYELLSDMRDLTDAFIAAHEGHDVVQDVDTDDVVPPLGPSLLHFELKAAEIKTRLASLPSAYTPGLPVTNDWVYEACRLASIIYASAIMLRLPFSVAAEPGRSPILLEAASQTNSAAGGHLLSTRLTEALYEVLEKTNMNDVWGPMSGVLYWVAQVGSASSRTPASVDMSQPPRTRGEAYTTWVRRCLIMFATRAMILLIFHHPLPIIYGQKRLLRVQELIGSGDARRLLS